MDWQKALQGEGFHPQGLQQIAAYKACDPLECKEQDILAAFDDAIAEGVDFITISVSGEPIPFKFDAIAVSSFHAGNNGPITSTVSSVAPWLFSIAASSTDREIISKVVLANGKTLTVSVFIFRI